MLHRREEAARCLLCENAPCTKACKTGDPARAIRAIRFDNEKNAWRWIKDCCDADLERAEQGDESDWITAEEFDIELKREFPWLR